jgi:hypothetical protein
VAELITAYAKQPPTGSSSDSTKQQQLALALCKILSQATEGTNAAIIISETRISFSNISILFNFVLTSVSDATVSEMLGGGELVGALFSILSFSSKLDSTLLTYAAKTLCHLAQFGVSLFILKKEKEKDQRRDLILLSDIEHRKEHIAKEGLHVLIGALDSSSEDLQFWTAQTIQNLCTGTPFISSPSYHWKYEKPNTVSRTGQSTKSGGERRSVHFSSTPIL